MSLWTPGGEHPVDRDRAESQGEDALEEDPLADLTPEERERAMAMAAEMDDVRRQLSSVPAAVVVANHAMGLYELAAIHLSTDPPNFVDAQLAIDAMGAVIERLVGRLGEAEPTLIDALGQLRLAYVQLHNSSETEADS
ncbi:MAG TPA: hypothetical protein VGJ03_01340 [Acidimicrobiales bacterium]